MTKRLSEILHDRRAEGFSEFGEAIDWAQRVAPDKADSVRMVRLLLTAAIEGANEIGSGPESPMVAAHAAGIAIAGLLTQAYRRDGWTRGRKMLIEEFTAGMRQGCAAFGRALDSEEVTS